VPERLIRRVVQLGFWLALAVASAAALLPGGLPLPIDTTDVVLHSFAFTVLTAALGLGFYEPARWAMPVRWMALYGLALELAQSFLPGRTAELKDLAVDAVGIALGVVLWCFAIVPLLRRAPKEETMHE
jgi:VanZ family protein